MKSGDGWIWHNGLPTFDLKYYEQSERNQGKMTAIIVSLETRQRHRSAAWN